jgi:selenocysteine lyase/cysteine desulfurase
VDWKDLKGALSGLLGGDPEGWVFPRNTTEGMSFVAHGLELEPGHEIVTTDHEHIGGMSAWELLAARRGAVLTRVRLPVPAESSRTLFEAIMGAVTDATRVVSVSHVTFTTGTVLPVADLSRALRERGVVLVVDGAHPPGMLQMDLTTLGGDFYASSPHKWLLAPQGTGLLHVTGEWQERLWPTLASGGWDDTSLGAHRFNHLGTFDESRMAGLLAAVHFHEILGPARVEARVLYLRGRLEALLAAVPGLVFASSQVGDLQTGMISFGIDGLDMLALQGHLARVGNIRTRVIGEYDYGWMRLSTHIYNRPEQLDRTVRLVAEAAHRGLSDGGPP